MIAKSLSQISFLLFRHHLKNFSNRNQFSSQNGTQQQLVFLARI